MIILFDTNIILDVLMDRKPHVTHSLACVELAEKGTIIGAIGATTLTTVAYMMDCALKKEGIYKNPIARNSAVQRIVHDLLAVFRLAQVTHPVLTAAANCADIYDYEDAVLYYAALQSNMNGIVTRNTKDFANMAGGPVQIMDPANLC